MTTIKDFDPPMCCSTGVRGPEVDTRLVQFAADLARFSGRGCKVERYNLSQQPEVFMQHAAVL